MFELNASVLAGEVPIRFGVIDVAIVLPGGDFVDEDMLIGNRRSRHWAERTPSSDSARLSQLPCLGV